MKVRKSQDANLTEDYVDVHYRKLNAQIDGLFQYLEAMDSIQGKNDRGLRSIPVTDVYFFETVDRKTWAYLEKEVYEVESGIHKLLEAFSGKGLVQISRSMCVNVFKIDHVQADLNMRYKIFLTNGETVIMNRSFKQGFFFISESSDREEGRIMKLINRKNYIPVVCMVFTAGAVLKLIFEGVSRMPDDYYMKNFATLLILSAIGVAVLAIHPRFLKFPFWVVVCVQYAVLITLVMASVWVEGHFCELAGTAYRDTFWQTTAGFFALAMVYFFWCRYEVKKANRQLQELTMKVS
ncbi:MAG: LytTR family transcriptional regulator [Clostridiales bacterium]|nr:LytTR family transcriptional regulator [Clostridiales bacterium]